MTEGPIPVHLTDPAPGVGTHYIMPSEMFPVHMFVPDFQTKGLWFPALDAWVLEMLCRKMRDKRDGKLDILEIGSFVGGSAVILAPHAGFMVCADTWAGSGKPGDEMAPLYEDDDVFATFERNTKTFVNLIALRRTLQPDTLSERLRKLSFNYDLIFIDGGHDYESVMADIEIAKEWIAPGGIICGHDFSQFRGVTQAALDFGLDAACGTVWWKEMP